MSNARPDNYQRIIIAEALAITILFHMALLFLFSYSPPQLKNNDTKTQKIAMLNLYDHGKSSMKELTAWLEYHDPSLISRPDQKFGYAMLCRNPDFRPPLSDLPREKKMETATVFEKFKKLSPENQLKYDICARFVNYTPTPLPKGKKNIETMTTVQGKYPVAVYGGGAELKPFFETTLPENLKEIAATAKPSKISLAFQGEGLMPRAAVEESSGNPDLDSAAIKEILFSADKFSAELVNPGDFVTITVLWNKPGVNK
jgi:hypothetical protein